MKVKTSRISHNKSSNHTRTFTQNGKTIYQPRLSNAQQIARANPDTFFAPSRVELNSIRKGTLVKICDGEERFWVIVFHISANYLIGRIDNELISGQDYSIGNFILFKKSEIYEVFSEETVQKFMGHQQDNDEEPTLINYVERTSEGRNQ